MWLLKYLIIDLDTPTAFQHTDPLIRKKLQALQNRFSGATQFLKKTIIGKQGKKIKLNNLPWYLLIGPTNAGKTTLLANSNINYILQRHFQQADIENLTPSEHCDWWITRDASIIDVPGKYLSTENKNPQKINVYPILWKSFLRLAKRQRGKKAISGIIIALPLPELMKQNDNKHYQAILHNLFQHLEEVQKTFANPIPCYLMITKCDLLPGFSQFFAEAGDDEIVQPWGILLPETKPNEKISDIFAARFNALIKRLNQQLLWRLHQERNPMMRPYIKDFPLQIERLKEFAFDFTKKFASANFTFLLQGVYLASAIQNKSEPDNTVLDDNINNTHRTIQLFKAPIPESRPYFIKQFLTQALFNTRSHAQPIVVHVSTWKSRTAYIMSAAIIAVAASVMGKDFQQGMKQAYAVQNQVSNYHLSLKKFNNPDEHLLNTLKLLNSLQEAAKNSEFKFNVTHIFEFYSNKSQQKASAIYHQALQVILIPEIKTYFEEYLRMPVNKTSDNVYVVLKAYLMLGDSEHFQPDYVINTVKQILPTTMAEEDKNHLIAHLQLALDTGMQPSLLNNSIIDQARKLLTTMPSLKLSYIILKHLNNNNEKSDINLIAANSPVFALQQPTKQIPIMFTAKVFSSVYSQQCAIAAQEAIIGNWVLGNALNTNKTQEAVNELTEQLRLNYVNNYIEIWESSLNNLDLTTPKTLTQADTLITQLISTNSPLLQLLQVIRENTYFEPIISASPKLQNLAILVNRENPSANLLYDIFSGLEALHQYIQTVTTASNEKKAAFDIISHRVKNLGTSDAINNLHLIAAKSPEPIKTWLEKISNDTWHFLMQDAGYYLDTSWKDQVIRTYQTDIQNHYPFSANTEREVDIRKFVAFFGNPGTVVNFYNVYLQDLVDISRPDWRWKTFGDIKLSFSDEILRQIQQAIRIHHTFFPGGDNKLSVQFSLQPYQIDKRIKNVKLYINDKLMTDAPKSPKTPHVINWPGSNKYRMTSVQLTMNNLKMFNRRYNGDWGWFKLINQTFESASSPKQMLINVSMNEQPAKYLIFTNGQFSPFLSVNLRHFHLPEQFTTQQA